jgi:diguanylate cyclase (GGDEF)-like protein/PAS domain S-box-containing protein
MRAVRTYFIGALVVVIAGIIYYDFYDFHAYKLRTSEAELEGLKKMETAINVSNILRRERGLTQLNSKAKKFYLNKSDVKRTQELLQLLDQETLVQHYDEIIKTHQSKASLELFEMYTNVIMQLSVYNHEIADDTHLYYEEDRENYLMISSVLYYTQYMFEQLGKVRGLGTHLIASAESNRALQDKITYNLQNYFSFKKKYLQNISTLDIGIQSHIDGLNQELLGKEQGITTTLKAMFENRAKISAIEFFNQVDSLVQTLSIINERLIRLSEQRIEHRADQIRLSLLITGGLFILFITFTLIATIILQKRQEEDERVKRDQSLELNTMNRMHDRLHAISGLKEMCEVSLNALVEEHNSISGVLYVYDQDTDLLSLAATYGVKRQELLHALELGEGIIGEVAKSREYQLVTDELATIQNIGLTNISPKAVITLPILYLNNITGVVQFTVSEHPTDEMIKRIKREISIVSTYLFKALNANKSERYLELIDEEIITSSTDMFGRIISVSNAFARISGYDKKELIGRKHSIVRHPDMEDKVFKSMWETITSGHIWQGEIKNSTKEGGFYWVDVTITPNFDFYGNITGYTAVRQNITDKKYIEELATKDALTKLYNRRFYEQKYEELKAIALQENRLLSFMLIDIDNFKKYNDNYGHQEGDTTLINVASLLSKITSSCQHDYAFRLGGEEFGLLYFTDDKSESQEYAQHVVAEVEALGITHEYNESFGFVTISAGVIMLRHGFNDEELVYKAADELLYHSKESGRNRVSFENQA